MSSTLLTDQGIEKLLGSVAVQRAFSYFDSRAEVITDEQIQINSIPAPPFGETERAKYLRRNFSSWA